MYTKRQQALLRIYKEEGADRLSYEEIVELLLAEYAVDGEKAEGIIRELVNNYGNLDKALDMSPQELARTPDMNKYAGILLAMIPGIAARVELSQFGKRPRLETYDKLEQYARPKYYGITVEVVYVFCLDSKWNLLGVSKLSIGTLDKVVVYPREILAQVIKYNANKVVITHNHPSDDPRPSQDDYLITERVSDSLKEMGISLEDHIIITSNDSYSFAMDDYFSNGKEWILDKSITEKRARQQSLNRSLDWAKLREQT